MNTFKLNNLSELRAIDTSGFDREEIQFAFILTIRRLYIWIHNVGGLDNDSDIVVPFYNPAVGRWIETKTIPVTHSHGWSGIDKTGSKLSDLSERSASDIDRGTLDAERLPEEVVIVSDRTPFNILAVSANGEIVPVRLSKEHVAPNASIPWDSIDFQSITPDDLGNSVEWRLSFEEDHFGRNGNYVFLRPASPNRLGGVRPFQGLLIDRTGELSVRFGTGEGEALEGNTPMFGDVVGEHASNVVKFLRNIELAFNVTDAPYANGYVITLDSSNPNTPRFILAPPGTVSGGGGAGPLPRYEHIQSIASNVWNINHRLRRYPSSVMLLDPNGTQFFGHVRHVDSDNTIVSLDYIVGGRAIIS